MMSISQGDDFVKLISLRRWIQRRHISVMAALLLISIVMLVTNSQRNMFSTLSAFDNQNEHAMTHVGHNSFPPEFLQCTYIGLFQYGQGQNNQRIGSRKS